MPQDSKNVLQDSAITNLNKKNTNYLKDTSILKKIALVNQLPLRMLTVRRLLLHIFR